MGETISVGEIPKKITGDCLNESSEQIQLQNDN